MINSEQYSQFLKSVANDLEGDWLVIGLYFSWNKKNNLHIDSNQITAIFDQKSSVEKNPEKIQRLLKLKKSFSA